MMFLTMTTSGSLAGTGIVSMSSRVSTTSARTVPARASRAAEAVTIVIRVGRCIELSLCLGRCRRRSGLDLVQSHLQIFADGRVDLGSAKKGAHRFDRGPVGGEQRVRQSDL